MNWELRYSLRMFQGRSKRHSYFPMTLLALCGITFGVSATMVSLMVIDGFQEAYQKAILGFNAHVVLMEEGGIKDLDRVNERMKPYRIDPHTTRTTQTFDQGETEQLIVASTPFVFREGLGILPEEITGVVLKGIDPRTFHQVYPLVFNPLGAEPDSMNHSSGGGPERLITWEEGKEPPVILGRALYRAFFPSGEVDRSSIKLLIPRGEGRRNIREYTQSFMVTGTFESGLYEFDSQFILTSLHVMEKLFDTQGDVSGLEMALSDPKKAEGLARRLEGDLPPTFQAIAWSELNESLFQAMKMEKTLFGVIMFLILTVCSFNIFGLILILILRHQQEIAILRALGATKRSLYFLFSLKALLLAFTGILGGSALSALLYMSLKHFNWITLQPEIYFISYLPVRWSWSVWFQVATVTSMACYLVAYLASRRLIHQGSLVQSFR